LRLSYFTCLYVVSKKFLLLNFTKKNQQPKI